ncbi:MAG: hypothetical protein V1792_09015 [Pseudomonadota bacterium]
MKLCCSTWTPGDRILVFTTDEAYCCKWLDNGHCGRDGRTLQTGGLQTCLNDLKGPPAVSHMPIPEGRTEYVPGSGLAF